MKRNTLIALISWTGMVVVVFLVGRIRSTPGSSVISLAVLGVVYLVLLWSPFLIVRLIEHRSLTSLGFRCVPILRVALWTAFSFFLVVVFVAFEAWCRVKLFGCDLDSAVPIPSPLPKKIVLQFLLGWAARRNVQQRLSAHTPRGKAGGFARCCSFHRSCLVSCIWPWMVPSVLFGLDCEVFIYQYLRIFW